VTDLVSGSVVRVVPPSEQLVRVVPVAGPQGPPGGSATVHDQITPVASVTIPHPLGRLPTVEVWSGGQQVFPTITASSTSVTIVLSNPAAFTVIIA
jgi:hypothetical protein